MRIYTFLFYREISLRSIDFLIFHKIIYKKTVFLLVKQDSGLVAAL